ncbi:MAG: penicillin acylase family protein, partial [Spirochaetales bacterium]
PFVVAGHNSDIAWGMTNVGVDDLDFYIEKVSADKPDRYLYRGEWKKMEVRKEIISVKGGTKVERTLRFTHRGPVISEIKKLENITVSMRWLGNEKGKDNVFRSIYLLNRAKDWTGFKDALTSFLSTSQNINYADTKGNIGIYCAAGIPVRDRGDGMALSPGWTGEYEWKGVLPFEQKPNSYNPAKGFVSSANNRTAGPSYRHHISRWGFAVPYRIDRINELLASKEKFSVEDFKQMHLDVESSFARMVLGELVGELKRAAPTGEKERKVLTLLEKWDGAMTPDSPAPTIFDAFVLEFLKETLADEMGDELFADFIKERGTSQHAFRNLWKNKKSVWFDRTSTADKKEGFSDISLSGFSGAIKRLSELMGGNPDKWQWGKVHTLTLQHPLGSVKLLDFLFNLNRGPYPLGGSYHTIPQFAYKNEAPFAVVHGPSQRHIYDLSDWDKSLSIIPTGNSGIPASGHYCDQTGLFANGEYHPDHFSRTAVEKNAVYTMTLRGE